MSTNVGTRAGRRKEQFWVSSGMVRGELKAKHDGWNPLALQRGYDVVGFVRETVRSALSPAISCLRSAMLSARKTSSPFREE